MATLGDFARELDHGVFVGRDAQLRWYQDWLAGGHPSVAVVNVVGHGGVGKSALLQRFVEVARDHGVPTVHLDGREIGAGRRGLLTALEAEDLSGAVERLDHLRGVLLIDTFRAAPGLFAPLFDELLPRLSLPVHVVVASRRELLPHGSTHPLRRAVRRMDLHHFDRAELHDYLARRGLDGQERERQVWRVGRGNPLATSIAADVLEHAGDRGLAAGQEWHRALPGLTERLLSDLEVELRELVEAAALVRQFDADLLAAMLGRPVGTAEVDHLAKLAMVRGGEHGLRLHEDVRRLVSDDLRRRRPDHVTGLRSRALRHYASRMRTATPRERERLVNERLYLWEHEVVARSLFPGMPDDDELVVEPAGPGDIPLVRRLWERYAAEPNPVQGGAPSDDLPVFDLGLWTHANTRVMVCRGRDGIIQAAGLEVRIAEETLEVLPDIIRTGVEALRRSGRSVPATASDAHLRYLGPIVCDPTDAAPMSRLARWAIGSWINGGSILVSTTMAGYAATMKALGFTSLPCEAAVGGAPVRALLLDLDSSGVEDWIARIVDVAPPQDADPTTEGRAEIRVLGGFEVRRDGRDATPVGLAAQAVKHVAVERGPLHVEVLVERLWPDVDADTGRTRLRNVLSRLRDSSGDLLRRDGDTLRLDEGAVVDAEVFGQAVLRATAVVRDDPERASALVAEALDAWSGDLLPGDLYVEAFAARRERLHRLHVTAHDVAAAAAAARGDVDGAVTALEHAIELDAFAEDRYLRAANLLRDAGRRGAAREMVRRAAAADERLGVPPSSALRALWSDLRT